MKGNDGSEDKVRDGRTGRQVSGALSHPQRMAESGVSTAEVAVILPIFLAFVFAIIEIGRAWAVQQALTAAASEGARVLVLPYGSGLTYSSESEVKAAAKKRVVSYLQSSIVSTGPETDIQLVKLDPGADAVYGTTDDQIYKYEKVKRGDRVGIKVIYDFETPLPAILGAFKYAKAKSGITMAGISYMWHE